MKKPEQRILNFESDNFEFKNSPVTCLGIEFPNDEARRSYFLDKLREFLKDPEFRKIEGFPIGKDEDILALSDPPYYTTCPNPFIEDFMKQYGKPYDPNIPYSREPFAADVSEGKYDPIYRYHPYPTKVPHKAIIRYILHYTEPGDVVFDGFCGTGMAGVAAQMCGDKATVESLGVTKDSPKQKYKVENDGTILRRDIDDSGKSMWTTFSKLGARRAVLNDISPAATFIAYNYNTPVDVSAFEREAKRILAEVEEECGWMYETKHDGSKDINGNEIKGRINYTVWSDVFVCPECANEVVFWEAAVEKEAGKVKDDFHCPHCHASLTKRSMDRAWTTRYDDAIKETVKQSKQVPVLINYSVDKERHQKIPDKLDLALINKIENTVIPYWFPTNRMMSGKETRRNDPIGITHVHHFYTTRNLYVLAKLASLVTNQKQLLLITKVAFQITKLYRFTYQSGIWGAGGGPLSGTLYIPSLVKELNIIKQLLDALKNRLKASNSFTYGWYIGSTLSSTYFPNFPPESVDYIFIDPPFGANLNYSELASLWEAWLKVTTENTREAIENDIQKKGPDEYRHLMVACFKEAYKFLKPGHWMTVEFSNTKASVWNSIQTALTEAGFIIANISALDKKKGSFKVVTTPTAVKQDLIISAYKPNGGFEERFLNEASTEEGAWDFVRTHLKYLPVIKKQGGDLVPIPERDPRILFDQMVAYYVRKGYPVPISSQEFQLGLVQRFIERDGMFFLTAQAAEYDRKKMLGGGKQVQLSLFISGEASAIMWLRNLIRQKPQTFQDINPLFMKEISGWQKHEKALELSELLKENFLSYDGTGEVPSQIHSYLSSNFKELRNLPKDDPALRAKAKDRWYVPDPNKAGDLEKLRERTLLREFEEYRESEQKRLKVFRLEAVRAGFKKAWQERDYATIIAVARKIPDKILQEDPKLLMWYDQAVTRTGEE
jgi:DNA modification methylase/rubredoxin